MMLEYWLRDWWRTRKYSSLVMFSRVKLPSLAMKYLILEQTMSKGDLCEGG
jgi:hypothetical protein